MKNTTIRFLLAALLVVALAFGVGHILLEPESVLAAEDDTTPSITVVGTAERHATPTIAYLDLGVKSEGEMLEEIQGENRDKMDRLIATLEEAGIAEQDIQTSGYYVSPQYDPETYSEVVGYQVSNALRVTVREIDRTGLILDAAVAAGANQAGGVQFDLTTEERNALYQEALKGAVSQGAGKAQALAENVGVRIDKPVHLSEGSQSQGPLPRAMMEESVAAAGASETPIVPGELTVTASVTLVYHMK